MPCPTALTTRNSTRFNSRHLRLDDIPALLQLESRQWDATQAASAEALHERLVVYPEMCVGSFCARTGQALSSLFLRPIEREKIVKARSWDDCAGDLGGLSSSSGSLFGISLTSIDPEALRSMERYIWPQLLQKGWREVYLGSPMPGLRQALSQDPTLSSNAYAHGKRRHLPRDVQLRYYHQKGLRDIMAVLPGYFPHGNALDYGVLLRGDLQDIAARACHAEDSVAANMDACAGEPALG